MLPYESFMIHLANNWKAIQHSLSKFSLQTSVATLEHVSLKSATATAQLQSGRLEGVLPIVSSSVGPYLRYGALYRNET